MSRVSTTVCHCTTRAIYSTAPGQRKGPRFEMLLRRTTARIWKRKLTTHSSAKVDVPRSWTQTRLISGTSSEGRFDLVYRVDKDVEKLTMLSIYRVLFVTDLNVEHAQLLVYLFHSLTLMQKKSVLLMTSNAIIKVSYIQHIHQFGWFLLLDCLKILYIMIILKLVFSQL